MRIQALFKANEMKVHYMDVCIYKEDNGTCEHIVFASAPATQLEVF